MCAGPGEHVLDGQQAQRDGRVLHGQQALQLPLQALRDDGAALGRGRVQQRGHQPVAQVVVGLPVPGVVLVIPGHLPGRHARQRHRREAAVTGPDAVLGVVPLDEHRHRQADLPDHLGRDEAHPPAVVVRLGPAVQPRRVPQVPPPEVVPGLGVRGRAPPPFVRFDGLGERVQQRPVVHAEHVAAHDGGLAGQVAERDRPQDALGVEPDVVVHEQDVVGAPRPDRLVHGPGESA